MRRMVVGSSKKNMLLAMSLVFMFLVIFSGGSVSGGLISAYETLQRDYPEFVERLKDGGATDAHIENFLTDLDKEVRKEPDLNEANFNSIMFAAVSELLDWNQHSRILRALAISFPDEVNYTVSTGRLHQELVPLRNAVKESVLSDLGEPEPEPVLSSEARLKTLTSSKGELTPAFNQDHTSYTLTLPEGTTALPDLKVTPRDDKATVTINKPDTLPGLAEIIVTAEDQKTVMTYKLEIDKAASTNASLKSLEVDAGILKPEFSADNSTYSVTLPHGTTRPPSVSATAADGNANLDIKQANSLPGTAEIKVTAADKTTVRNYRVEFALGLSPNANLKELSVSAGRLNPSFNADVNDYTVTLKPGNTEVPQLTAKPADESAKLQIRQADTLPGDATVKVTSEDGKNVRLYTVRFEIGYSGDALLRKMELSEGTLAPTFSPETTRYTALLPAGTVDAPKIAATAADDNASLTINQAETLPGSAAVIVTADDGKTKKTYRVHFDLEEERLPANPISGATGEVDQEIKRQLDEGHKVVTLEVTAGRSTISLSGNTLKETADRDQILELRIGRVILRLDPGTFQVDDNRTLTISTRPLSTERAADALQHLKPETKLIGDVYEFNCSTEDSIFGVPFQKPVTVVLSYAGTDLDPDDEEYLDAFRFSELSKEWLRLDGTVNRARQTVTFKTDGFSKFAILQYAAAEPADPPEVELPDMLFPDLAGHWAEDNIKKLVELDAIAGYPDGSFGPDKNITRAEFAAVLVRAFGLALPAGSEEIIFSDTDGHWARKVVSVAASHGIVSGYSEALFGPDDQITREQMAAMIVNAVQLSSPAEQADFADRDHLAPWAKGAVDAAVAAGVITGYPDNTFKPKNNATRAEAAVVVVNALN